MGPTGEAKRTTHKSILTSIKSPTSLWGIMSVNSAGANKEIDQGNDVIEGERSQQVRMIDDTHAMKH